MITSSKGIALIKRWEGCKLKAYLCPSGIPTIGYGCTYYGDIEGSPKVKLGDVITQQRAEDLFNFILHEREKELTKLFLDNDIHVTQNEFDALIDWCFNFSVGRLKKSTMFKLLKEKKHVQASKELLNWIYANGEVSQGLINRREEEFELFNK